MMMWLAMVLWSGVVALACGVAFLLTVGRAFGRRSSGTPGLPDLILSPGHLLARGNAVAIVLLSWATWSAVGAVVCVLIWRR